VFAAVADPIVLAAVSVMGPAKLLSSLVFLIAPRRHAVPFSSPPRSCCS